MEIHIDKLNSPCRYGNCQFTKNDYTVLADNFSEELKQLSCNISKDKQNFHPWKTCNKHKVLRVRTAKTKGLEFGTNIEIFEFLLNSRMSYVRYVNSHQGSIEGHQERSEGLVLVSEKYILTARH